MIKDIEKFKGELLEWGYEEGKDYTIWQNDEYAITIEFYNMDPLEEICTLNEVINDFDKESIYDARFLKTVIRWERDLKNGGNEDRS